MSERRATSQPAARSRDRRRAAAEPVEQPAVAWDRDSWRHLVAFALILAVVAGAGILAQRAADTRPSGALAGCHPGRQLAPRTYLAAPKMCIDTHRKYIADVTTTRGKLTFTLDPTEDPLTVNNFVVLATNGFYDGLSFWHVESWYVQAGDPGGNGRGGPGYTLPDEPSAPGWGSGAVAMARIPNGAVSGSQFLVLKGRWPGGGPPGNQTYNRFGRLSKGLDVLDSVTSDDRIISISVRPA